MKYLEHEDISVQTKYIVQCPLFQKFNRKQLTIRIVEVFKTIPRCNVHQTQHDYFAASSITNWKFFIVKSNT